jgi:hypothetical protein
MERCAPEVWVEILRHIGGSKDTRARILKATSLVFKALTPYAQAELFRFVSIKMVSDAEHLLEAFTSDHVLQQCIRELELRLASYRDKVPLYNWLLPEPGTAVLASFTRVTFLELWGASHASSALDIQTIFCISSQFKAVKYLRLGFSYTDFKQVAALFSCLGSTLRHLNIIIGIRKMNYEVFDPSDVPSVLSAEALSHYAPQDALPHLDSLQLGESIGAEFAEWFFHSGVINRIRTLKVIPELLQDVEYAALLLSRGYRRLECLVLDMTGEGWRLLDTSIGMLSRNVFQINLAHVPCQPRLSSLRTSQRFASLKSPSDTRRSCSSFSQRYQRKTL